MIFLPPAAIGIAYRQRPSFTDYLLISQDRMLVEHYQKRADEWVLHEHSAPDHAVTLPSLRDAQLRLGELYEQIELPEA